MGILNHTDYKLFEQIVKLTETNLKQIMANFLKKHYDKVICTNDYVYAIGDLPVMVIAHLDTVFSKPPEHLYYDKEQNVIWSPEGLGADDRAGIYGIIKIVRRGYKPSILLTTGEEIGGIGARAFVMENPKAPDNLKYIIQLDRQGSKDCVFYNCANPDFTKYITSFGFVEEWGTFTDISTICPRWKIAGVNLSIGYINEHSVGETFHINWFHNTMNKVYKMLDDCKKIDKSFEYIYDISCGYGGDWFRREWYSCVACGENCLEHEIFPMSTSKGNIEYYCPSCVIDYGNWCQECGHPFKVEFKEQTLCFKCLKKKENNIEAKINV